MFQAGAGGLPWRVGAGRLSVPSLCVGLLTAGGAPHDQAQEHPQPGRAGHVSRGVHVPELYPIRQAGACLPKNVKCQMNAPARCYSYTVNTRLSLFFGASGEEGRAFRDLAHDQ